MPNMSVGYKSVVEQIIQTDLVGSVAEIIDDDLVTFERLPLLLTRREEREARAGNAVWRDAPKGWYASSDSDLDALVGWLPDYLAAHTSLAEGRERCWKCSDMTPVYCLASRGEYLTRHEVYDENQTQTEAFIWSLTGCGAFFGNLVLANGSLLRMLATQCPNYHLDYSKQAQGNYFMNHCASCGAKLGDFYMHSEPGGAFFPTSDERAKEIKLRHFSIPLLLKAGAGVTSPDPLPHCTDLGWLTAESRMSIP
ncbi:hypothetical protein [Burkholderia ambifaria]|uniref:hypothetical protein n=1 Tax=Burkholderia ambifaria TaxID=152480 RepID=UPI00158D7172|nr:hypothetical protein [Burkholderia ambifaria]